MSTISGLDQIVGKIAGAIYMDVNRKFSVPPMMLIPAITFKIRKLMEQITDLKMLTTDHRTELAKEIQTSISPILYSYEISPDAIKSLEPIIELAALNSLLESSHKPNSHS